ncbi:hypothetical protein [Nocardioides pakistanensis]
MKGRSAVLLGGLAVLVVVSYAQQAGGGAAEDPARGREFIERACHEIDQYAFADSTGAAERAREEWDDPETRRLVELTGLLSALQRGDGPDLVLSDPEIANAYAADTFSSAHRFCAGYRDMESPATGLPNEELPYPLPE